MATAPTITIASQAPLRRRRGGDVHVGTRQRLRGDPVTLVPSVGGWSLVDAVGDVIAERRGAGARSACLQYARSHTILALRS